MDEWDVFLVHSSDDRDIALNVHKGLSDVDLRVLDFRNTTWFSAGKLIFENIVKAVHSSTHTVVILTENSIRSSWVTLETILGLEKSQQTKKLCIRLLNIGVHESKLKHLKIGVLETMPHLKVDFNKKNWAERLKTDLETPVSLVNILPSGNVAHGQVYSHYNGYFRHILPVFQQKVRNCEWFKKYPKQMSTKYYLPIPGTCQVFPTLETPPGVSPQITKAGHFEVDRVHGGKPRKYTPTIYRIKEEDSNEEYFFVGEFANSMSIISKLKEKGLADVDVRLQIGRFYYTMNKVLSYTKHDYSDIVRQLPFNESIESTSEVLLEAVKEDIYANPSSQMNPVNESNTRVPLDRLHSHQPKNYKYHATISCSNDVTKDRTVAAEIQNELSKRGLTWESGDGTKLDRLREARWNIYVISSEALQKENWMKAECISALHESVDEDQLKVVPVTVDIKDKQIPDFLKWVTYISHEEPRYLDKLLKVITGEDIKMHKLLPAGDVATGLMWAYCVNYLPLTLHGLGHKTRKDLRGRIIDHLIDKRVTCGCLLRFYVIMPKSCACEVKQISDRDRIEDMGQIEAVHSDQGGVPDRAYRLRMYKLTTGSGMQYCFLSEYATPGITLHEMANHFHDAGLTKDEMYKQALLFTELLETKIRDERYKREFGDIYRICRSVYFDDGQQNLTDVLERQVMHDVDEGFELLTRTS